MTTEPYKTPDAVLDAHLNFEVPSDIASMIRGAWIAGSVSTVITLLFLAFAMSDINPLGIDVFAFIDILLMGAFTFGIYKKSRTCAILMLLLFIANKIIMFLESGAIVELPVALIFCWFYGRGVIGTFRYHQLKNMPQQD